MTIITPSFFLQTSNAENHLLYLYYFCLAGRFQQNQDRRSQPARHKDAGQWLNPREKCFVSLSLPAVPATVHMCFSPAGLHTCTYQPLYALSRKCRLCLSSLIVYSVSFSPKDKCTYLMARAHVKFLLLLLLDFLVFF